MHTYTYSYIDTYIHWYIHRYIRMHTTYTYINTYTSCEVVCRFLWQLFTRSYRRSRFLMVRTVGALRFTARRGSLCRRRPQHLTRSRTAVEVLLMCRPALVCQYFIGLCTWKRPSAASYCLLVVIRWCSLLSEFLQPIITLLRFSMCEKSVFRDVDIYIYIILFVSIFCVNVLRLASVWGAF